MKEIRITHKLDPKLNHNCDLIHIDDFTIKEVILPRTKEKKERKAFAITIQGRNFEARAEVLVAYVGEHTIKYLRISPDERTLEGILIEEPLKGSHVGVILGDDHARHPDPVDPSKIQRLE